MTTIIKTWLSKELDQTGGHLSIEEAFANGYLLGKILNKYGFQKSFHLFKDSNSSDSIIKNYSYLASSLQDLGISLNASQTKEIVSMKPGSIYKILYQIYILLERIEKNGAPGSSHYSSLEHSELKQLRSNLYTHQLKQMIPRQSDVNLAQIMARFERKRKLNEKLAKKSEFKLITQQIDHIQQLRKARLNRSHEIRLAQSELMAKLKNNLIELPQPVKISKPQSVTDKSSKIQSNFLQELNEFEINIQNNRHTDNLETNKSICQTELNCSQYPDQSKLNNLDPSLSAAYLSQIHAKFREKKMIVSENQKRRRRLILDLLEAHHIQQEELRAKQMNDFMARQSQLERRITVQLEQVKQEKSIILSNRLEREKQYEARRELEFQQSMNLEREMLLGLKQEEKHKLEILKQYWAEQSAHRRQITYEKHYNFVSSEVVELIVQLVLLVVEYRTLTGKLIPARLFRQWKTQFVADHNLLPIQSQYVPTNNQSEQSFSGTEIDEHMNEENENLLDETDLYEYQHLVGDWDLGKVGTIEFYQLPNELIHFKHGQSIEWINTNLDLKLPTNLKLINSNPTLEWIIDRLYNINNPLPPTPPIPDLPTFPIKCALLGKPLSGKSTIIQELEKRKKCVGINPYTLILQALKAYEAGKDKMASPTPVEVEENEKWKATSHTFIPFSTLAKFGELIYNELKQGESISDEILVNLIFEVIKSIPDGIGFVLNGFPANYNQAKLFEQKFIGSDQLTDEMNIRNTSQSKNSSILTISDRNTESGLKNNISINKFNIKSLDLLILLDINNETVLKRASHHQTVDQIYPTYRNIYKFNTNELSNIFNETINDNEHANINNSNYVWELITNRLTGFIESFPKLAKFYKKKCLPFYTVDVDSLKFHTNSFSNHLNKETDQKINSENNLNKLAVYLEVERIIEELIEKKKQTSEYQSTNELIDITPIQQDLESVQTIVHSSIVSQLESSNSNGQNENQITKLETNFSQQNISPNSPKQELNDVKCEKQKRNSRTNANSGHKINSGRRSSSRSSTKQDSKLREINSKEKINSTISHSPTNPNSRTNSARKHSKKESEKSNKKQTETIEISKQINSNENELLQPKLPKPGDEDYQFVNLPIMHECAQALWMLWNNSELVYVKNLKSLFRNLRQLTRKIIPKLYEIKQQFYNYLYRPDSKQIFVTQFVNSFNSVLDEMRSDAETKADLHCRTDDLRDTIYELIDESKLANENYMNQLIDLSGWFNDKQCLITNIYLALYQVELNRFQEHAQLIKDYYSTMESKPQVIENETISTLAGTIDTSRVEYTRIPLVQLPEDPIESEENSTTSTESPGTRQSSSRSGSNRDKTGKENSHKRRSNRTKSQTGPTSLTAYPDPIEIELSQLPPEFHSQVNLLNYKSSVQDILTAFTKNGMGSVQSVPIQMTQKPGKGQTGNKPTNATTEKINLPNPNNLLLDKLFNPTDPPSQFLYNSCLCIIHIVNNMVQTERTLRTNEAIQDGIITDVNLKPKDAKTTNKLGSADKNQATASRKSITKLNIVKDKQTKQEEISSNTNEISAEEEQKLKELRQKIREEHLIAIEVEAFRTTVRLTLIRAQGIAVLSDLQAKLKQIREIMTDWIGVKTLREHDAVNNMLEVIRYTIEKETKIYEKIILDGDEFFIEEDKQKKSVKEGLLSKNIIDASVNQNLCDLEPQYFTLAQLKSLFHKLICDNLDRVYHAFGFINLSLNSKFIEFITGSDFSEVATSGFVEVYSFKTIVRPLLLERLTQLSGNCSEETSQELLLNLIQNYRSPFELDTLISYSNLFDKTKPCNQINYIDWRRFLLAACQPAISYHHSKLLCQASLVELAQRLLNLDSSGNENKCQTSNLLDTNITRAQFQFAPFKWFPNDSCYYQELHDFIFSLFVNQDTNPNDDRFSTTKITSKCENLFQPKLLHDSSQGNDEKSSTNSVEFDSATIANKGLAETIHCADLLLNLATIDAPTAYIGFLRCLAVLSGKHLPYYSAQGDLVVTPLNIENEGIPQTVEDCPIPIEIMEKVLNFGLLQPSLSTRNKLQQTQLIDAPEPENQFVKKILQEVYSDCTATGYIENNTHQSNPKLSELLDNSQLQNLLIHALPYYKLNDFTDPWPNLLRSYIQNSNN